MESTSQEKTKSPQENLELLVESMAAQNKLLRSIDKNLQALRVLLTLLLVLIPLALCFLVYSMVT